MLKMSIWVCMILSFIFHIWYDPWQFICIHWRLSDEQMVKQLCEWTNSITQCSVPAETHDQETVETESKQESVVDLKNAEDTMVKIMT